MTTTEKAIQELLELLDSWYPISPHFRQQLASSLTLQQVNAKQHLSYEGSHITSAWYNIDCWVIAYQSIPTGIEEVIAIHPPSTIFTEAQSFLQQRSSLQRILVLEGSSLLAIQRQTFNQLRNLPETQPLLEHYLLQDSQQQRWRTQLLSMKDSEKVKAFAEKYPINQLPGNVVASFLRMTQAHLSIAKANFNRNR